jgi:hypothetical protein
MNPDNSYNTCFICEDDTKNPSETFPLICHPDAYHCHYNCIDRWADISTTCPVCREPLEWVGKMPITDIEYVIFSECYKKVIMLEVDYENDPDLNTKLAELKRYYHNIFKAIRNNQDFTMGELIEPFLKRYRSEHPENLDIEPIR